MSVDEAPNYHGPRYFVITFVLCGVIAGCVLAVVALYVVRRHSRSKQKLMQLAGQGEGLEASKDYQVRVLNVCQNHWLHCKLIAWEKFANYQNVCYVQ